jgi:CUB/sushi domain-containing protein
LIYTGVVLNDGQWHHLAVTWTSSGGALRVYKDGALAYSGTVRSGATLTGNGALVLGQEQDSVNGGFSSSQAFLGQLDDVALYPSALSQTRVQAHRQAGIAPGCATTLDAASVSAEEFLAN